MAPAGVEPRVPGAHLAAPGPYQETIARLTKKYPNLKYRDYKLWESERTYAGPPRVAFFDFQPGGNANVTPQLFSSAQQISAFLAQSAPAANANGSQRRLWVMEGLCPANVALFGPLLQIDPRVFMHHQRTAFWEHYHEAGNTPRLPSLFDNRNYALLEYPELLSLKLDKLNFTARSAEDERHISLSRRDGKFDNVAISHKKASFWSRETSNGGWDVLLIVDESLRRILTGTRANYAVEEVHPQPWQGGYADFIPFESLAKALATPGPPRTSMFDDICYYFEHNDMNVDISDDPRSTLVFAQKIVASQYMLLIQYTRSLLNHLGWVLSRRDSFADLNVDWVEERWSDLLSFHRRCDDHRGNIQAIIAGLSPEDMSTNQRSWTDVRADFAHIERQFGRLQEKSDSLISSFTGLASIVGNRQSLAEARSVRLLTLLGITFLPLSFISGLFSMATPYTPGSSCFWIYFAVSLPLLLLVFMVAFPIQLWFKTGHRMSIHNLGRWLTQWTTLSRRDSVHEGNTIAKASNGKLNNAHPPRACGIGDDLNEYLKAVSSGSPAPKDGRGTSEFY